MKLCDLILPTKKDKKNYTTLIVNLQSLTYFELNQIYSVLDNKNYLSQQVRDWHPIHYAALNSDFRVLDAIIELYKKHHLNLDILTQSNKNSIPENSNAMDIAYIKESFSNIITLYKHNLLPNFLFKKGIVGLTNRYDDIKEEDISILMQLPHINNIITPILYYNHDCQHLLEHFLSIDFEEKETLILEFKENLDYFYSTAFKIQNMKVIDSLTRKLEYIGEGYKDNKNRSHIVDILLIPFYQSFDYLIQLTDNEIINMINSKYSIKAFQHSTVRPLYQFLNIRNLVDVIPHLDSQQFNIFANKFIGYYHKLKPIMANLDKERGVEFFDSLYPIILSNALNSSLNHKPQPHSRGKI